MSATLGVSISGDTVRMALSGARHPVVTGTAASILQTGPNGAPVRLDIDDEIEEVPGGTIEEAAAATIRNVLDRELADGTAIGQVMVAYHDEAQARQLDFALHAQGIIGYHLIPSTVAALRALTASHQVGDARSLVICHVDPWWFRADAVSVVDGAPLSTTHTVATDVLAVDETDALTGIGYVVGEAIAEAGHDPDLVVLMGEGTGEPLAAEDIEREVALPVVIPSEPEMLTARGAALLAPPTVLHGVAEDPIASAEFSPTYGGRKLPSWASPAAAVAGILALCIVGGALVVALGSSGVFKSSKSEAAGATTTASAPAPAVSEAAPPPPVAVAPPPAPAPGPAPAPAVAPQAPVDTYQAPVQQQPVQQQPAAPPVQQAPAPAPVPDTPAQPEPAPAPEQAPAPAPEQAPAPVLPPAIVIPGLPPIQLPRVPGL